MAFEGNSLLGLISRLRGAFYHRDDRTMTIYGLRTAIAAKTADYTMTGADFSLTVACSVANITITLPPAASNTGQIYTIVKTDTTAYWVAIDPNGAEQINGVSTFAMTGRNSAAVFQSNGTGWYFLSRPRDSLVVFATSNYSLGQFDGTLVCTSGTFAATLPSAVGCTGRVYNIKNTGNGTITINTTSAQTIDGNASGILKLAQYDNLTVQSTGSAWIIL
jgi:hypothetical protein